MAPIATVVARISAVIAVAVGRIVAIAVAIGRIVVIAISVMRVAVSVAIVGVTARADVDINLCRCVSGRKHR
jgi:hypothetical protein